MKPGKVMNAKRGRMTEQKKKNLNLEHIIS
jgi:hypothetical protein